MNWDRLKEAILGNILLIAGAICWGIFIVVGTMEVVFFGWFVWLPILLYRELRRIMTRGFHFGLVYRPLIVIGIVSWAAQAPYKYADRQIISPPQLNRTMTLQQAQDFLYHQGIRFRIPETHVGSSVRLPSTTGSLKKVFDSIEAQTGLSCSLGYCGNGSSILYGGYPMSMGFYER